MLTELHIENFAIIEELDLHFNQGLITFTGETGAGKSIIIDAVETLLGGRADATLVRVNSDHAVIEGVFQISSTSQDEILSILQRESLQEDDPHYLTLSREIRINGRNIARVNGRSVNASLLREIGDFLVDVHGQSEHLSLLRVNQHLGLLDNYISITEGLVFESTLSHYRQTYQRLQSIKQALALLRQSERDAARRADLLRYQIQEIEDARLRPGEDNELRDERNRLANAENLASLTQQALVALDDGTPESPAITDLIGQVSLALSNLVRLDPSQARWSDQVDAISVGLSDLSMSLRDYLEAIEFNPRRLNQVEERLGLIHNLKRKYGETIAEILGFASRSQRDLEAITNAGEKIEKLEIEHASIMITLANQGQELYRIRKAAAEKLDKAIESELVDLHMSGARFKVDFQLHPDPNGVKLEDGQTIAYHSNGLERIEFLIAPNPGEGFKPLAKIASGGETSRLMLALKNVLAKADQIPTLIFDEIDQGIGGRVGTIVGEKLWSLARDHQVLCITHLPQLAAFGDQHYLVQKILQDGRTLTQVTSLNDEERLIELAQMIGDVGEGALHTSRELMQYVKKHTK